MLPSYGLLSFCVDSEDPGDDFRSKLAYSARHVNSYPRFSRNSGISSEVTKI